jgi:large subunit ribosomal protein L22
MKAILKNYKQSPRKVRLFADLVRGKSVDRALMELRFMPQKASDAVAAVIASAVANAENNFAMNVSDLKVSIITVNEGVVMKRFRPVSRGMAHPFKRRTSIIEVILAEK